LIKSGSCGGDAPGAGIDQHAGGGAEVKGDRRRSARAGRFGVGDECRADGGAGDGAGGSV